jgi:hypothetical protein
LCFIACEFFLNSHDSSDRRKPLAVDPSKTPTQHASSSHATLIAPPAGVTGSTTLLVAEAWDYCRRAAEILEGLKNRKADQEGNTFTPLLFLSFFQSLWLTYDLLICSVGQ